MGKKNYITEITDTFGSEINSKEALKLAKKMKSAQLLAYPSSEYKTKLKDRLQNIYIIDQGQDIPSRFSIFQIFGAFASFAFIAGTLFMVFDVRQDLRQAVYQDMILEESLNIEKSKQDISSIPELQEKEEEIQIIKKTVTEEVSPKIQVIENIFSDGSANTYKQAGEIIHDTEITLPQSPQVENLNIGEDVDDTVVPVGNTGMRSESIHPEEMYSEEMPEASSSMMMMDMRVGETQEMSFGDICAEYNGEISEDGLSCILENGKVCEHYNIHNIYECVFDEAIVPRDETIEIDLEELIEAYGQ